MNGENLRVGVLGATGLVGRAMVACLERSSLEFKDVRLWATERGAGSTMPFRGAALAVEAWSAGAHRHVDALLLATKGDVSRGVAPEAAADGTLVIDNSSAFRMDPDVPLVVPEVNPAALSENRGIIANPNCSTIQLVAVLAPLHEAARLARVVVATYQSVSGVGREGLMALEREESGEDPGPSPFAAPIHRNVVPQCDAFLEDGWTREEWKLQVETRKILELPRLDVAATCVRVPVAVSHGEAVTADFHEALSPGDARARLAASGVHVEDDPSVSLYPTPAAVEGRDGVFVGRIRGRPESPRTVHLWIVADNLLKGAAANAVDILECMVFHG